MLGGTLDPSPLQFQFFILNKSYHPFKRQINPNHLMDMIYAEKLPEVKINLRPWGPREDAKLSEFQIELIQLASQLNGDHVLKNYADIGRKMSVREANEYVDDAVNRFLEAGSAALRTGANESAIVAMRPALTSRSSASDGGFNKYLEAY